MAQALRCLLLPEGRVPGAFLVHLLGTVCSELLDAVLSELLCTGSRALLYFVPILFTNCTTLPFFPCCLQTAQHWNWGAMHGPPTHEVIERLTSPTVSRELYVQSVAPCMCTYVHKYVRACVLPRIPPPCPSSPWVCIHFTYIHFTSAFELRTFSRCSQNTTQPSSPPTTSSSIGTHTQFKTFEFKFLNLLTLQSDHYTAIQFTYYLQFHLHKQLLSVSGWRNTYTRIGESVKLWSQAAAVGKWVDGHIHTHR